MAIKQNFTWPPPQKKRLEEKFSLSFSPEGRSYIFVYYLQNNEMFHATKLSNLENKTESFLGKIYCELSQIEELFWGHKECGMPFLDEAEVFDENEGLYIYVL